jgi:hypothetical protein
VLTGGFPGWHFRVKREGSRASQRSTCHQHPDCNTPLPVRSSPLLKQRQLKLPIRGGKEVVEHGKSGFIIPVDNFEAICEYIRALYSNPELLNRMSAASELRIAQDFTSAQTTEKMISYFQRLLLE